MILLFLISIAILILGYFFYSPIIEKQFKIDYDMVPPSHANNDGVDFMPVGKKRNFLMHLINIAGTGPIYGPIMAALFGPIVLILIPIGNILAGAVMDYGFGVLTLNNKAVNLPFVSKKYIGNWAVPVITFFTVLILILVGTVFVITPANLIASNFHLENHIFIITVLIFAYYMLATVLPVDKIMAPVYPYFALILLIGTVCSTVGLFYLIFTNKITVPTIDRDTLFNYHPAGVSLVPGFIVAISCGLISGFHTTQTPLVAKTLNNVKDAKSTFYGMMVVEGLIAVIWAFFTLVLFSKEDLLGLINSSTQAGVVREIANMSLGALAPILIITVIIMPISTGDTAFRSLRTIISEMLKINQIKPISRILTSIPMFLVSMLLMKIGYQVLWNYFTWANHMAAIMTLILLTVYLKRIKSNYLFTLLPLLVLFYLNNLYILTNNDIGFGLPPIAGHSLAVILALLGTYFSIKFSKPDNVEV